MRPLRAGALALLLAAPSCVTLNFGQLRAHQPPDLAAAAALAPGRSSLAECLAVLGAPATVAEEGDGAVLTWTWDEREDSGVGVSVPIADTGSLTFQYGRLASLPHRLVLRFDAEWTLAEGSSVVHLPR